VIVAGRELEPQRATIERTFGAWTVEDAPPRPHHLVGVIALRHPTRVHSFDTMGGEPRFERAIRAVTARDVKLTAQRYLPQSEMLTVLAGPRSWIEVPVAALHLSAIEHWSFQR
jgi:hypothetical protein